MSVLPNARHERFAQELARGLTLQRAYTAAGYKGNRHHASALGTKQHIKNRVAELLSRNVAKQDAIATVTVESLMTEAEAARVKAMSEKGGAAAAVAAMTAKAKLAGLWLERVERKNLHGDLSAFSDAELAEIVRQGADSSKLN